MKRLDFNGDGKVDLCEFHAFLGFPNCQYCCPIEQCHSCGIHCCELCLSDVPCFSHKFVHTKFYEPNKKENKIEEEIKKIKTEADKKKELDEKLKLILEEKNKKEQDLANLKKEKS